MTLTDLESFDDIWDKQVQQDLIDFVESGESIPEVIETMIKIHRKRRAIMVGLYNRTQLRPASKFEGWTDPRAADGIPIFARKPPGITKENHRLHTTFDKTIINNKASYMTGIPVQISVVSDEDESERADDIKDVFRSTDFDHGLGELSQRATGRGTSFVLLSSPPGELDMYITMPYEWTCIVLYDAILGTPKYALRYWEEIKSGDDGSRRGATTSNEEIRAEWYDDTTVRRYEGSSENLSLVDEAEHLFAGVPLVEFPNNTERIGDSELSQSLQDAFDVVDSDLVNELAQLRLAYMYIRNLGVDIDDEWIKNLTFTGVFSLEDGGEAGFVEKNLNAAAVENLKIDLERRIYRYSNSYNPDEIGQSGDMTAFQIRQRLFKLESSAKETETLFKLALRQMVGLIIDFYDISVDPDDVEFTFTRNIPRNTLQDVREAVGSGFRISQAGLARLVPFEIDQEQNAAELEEESTIDIFEGEPVTPPEPGEQPPVDSVSVSGQAGAVGEETNIVQLNGAQVASATEIVKSVGTGEISREAAVNLLKVMFNLEEAQANSLVENMEPRPAPTGGPPE